MSDEISDFYYFLFSKFGLIIILILIVIAGAFIFGFNIPGRIAAYRQAEIDATTPIGTQVLLYNGTLSMITYQYGFWGSVDSTKLFFLDDAQFTFNHQVICKLGKNYTITLKETTFEDNHTETEPTSIGVFLK